MREAEVERGTADAADPAPDRLPGYLHLRVLFSPLFTLLYLLTAPHPAWQIGLFLGVQFLVQRSESRSPDELRQPAAGGAIFIAIPCALFALHFLNLFLTARLLQRLGLFTLETLPALFFLCLSSVLAGGSAAHELIHRRERLLRWLGRLLLISYFHDHFYIEHLRGHHVHVGTPDDPATARYGESLGAFLRRTLRDQFRSAWRLDRGAVLLGIVAELCVAALFFVGFGGAGLLALLVQAASTIFFIQAINYIEHWGLTRTGRLSHLHAWNTANRNTLLGMLGFARHADHHLNPGRSFQALRFTPDSPRLPYGYDAMVGLALFRNRKFQELLTRELERQGLRAPAAAKESMMTR